MGGGGWEGIMEGDGTMRMVRMDGKVKGNLGFRYPFAPVHLDRVVRVSFSEADRPLCY